MPIGEYGWGSDISVPINNLYAAHPMNTIGADIAYNITSDVKLSLGYYYQDESTGYSGAKARLAYDIANGLTAGFTYTYDAAYQSVAMGDIKWRFGSNGYASPNKKPPVMPVIQALAATPANRDVRVHVTQPPLVCKSIPRLASALAAAS